MAGERRAQRRSGVRADARLLIADQVHALRHTPYEVLSLRAAVRARVEDVNGLNGDPYRRSTGIRRVRRFGTDELQILIQICRPGWLGRLAPLAEELLIATPDGRLMREWSVPGDPEDHRPFRVSR